MGVRSLTGQKCFITGAASGIGRATALAAAAAGAELFLTDIHQELLDGIVAELERAGGRVAAVEALDISDFESVRAFAERIHARHGAW